MLQLTTIFFLISFSLLAVLHTLAIKLFLYWRLPWLDMPVHFFGGAIVALGLYTMKDLRFISSEWLSVLKVLAFVLFVAAVWEVFELYAGVPIDEHYLIDTTIDILMGLGGGYVGYFVGKQLHNL